jgi:dipeptidase
VRTISNGLTIGSEFDLASDNLVSHAVDRGWCKGHDDFSFARCYADFIYTTFSRSAARHACTTDFLRRSAGMVTVQTVIDALRDHGPDAASDEAGYSPSSGLASRQICQHAGYGPIRGDQTTGSMVVYLAPEGATHFLTGTAAPCTSIFKPVWTGVDLPDTGPEPTGIYDEAALWWRHETLHRATLLDFPARLALYAGERDQLEGEFVAGALACRTAPLDERAAFMRDSFARAAAAESEWRARVLAAEGAGHRGPLYSTAWASYNRAAEMPS